MVYGKTAYALEVAHPLNVLDDLEGFCAILKLRLPSVFCTFLMSAPTGATDEYSASCGDWWMADMTAQQGGFAGAPALDQKDMQVHDRTSERACYKDRAGL